MKEQNNEVSNSFKPFVPADKIMPELTVTSIILGMLLAVIFGGANAYLGLRVGMTVSASIPAAVISMGLIRGVLRRDSILENNMVQTIGSAGESVAAGCIFTVPALFLWYSEGTVDVAPNYFMITAIALIGGVLGVLFMIPLRKALIVKEHGVLPYPEGTACAEVLLAGEEGGSKAKITFIGLGIGAVYKIIADGLQLFTSEVDYALPKFKGTGFGADILPALLGVGYIVGAKISSYMLSGAILGWFVVMPVIYFFGSLAPDIIVYPSSVPIAELDHWGLWSYYLRYIGAGAVAFGGIYSLVTSIPTIVSTFTASVGDLANLSENKNEIRTDKDLSLKLVLIASLVLVLIMGMTPVVPVGILGALIIAVFGFFFATVASRIVGLVGSSNSPVSGMTIATLLITAFIFKATGNDGQTGMLATMAVGSIICIIAAISGDTSQDLKTGYLIGATPKKQQIGEIIGVATSAVAIGGIMILLNSAWGFGSKEIPAPQATLMKLVVEGVMGGQLPWTLVLAGAGIGATLAVLRLPILPIAIGLYLPIHLSVPIMCGGLVRQVLDSKLGKGNDDAKINKKVENGILFASGLIAGEGLIGILLAVFAVLNINIALSADGPLLGQWVGVVAFGILIAILCKFSIYSDNDKK